MPAGRHVRNDEAGFLQQSRYVSENNDSIVLPNGIIAMPNNIIRLPNVIIVYNISSISIYYNSIVLPDVSIIISIDIIVMPNYIITLPNICIVVSNDIFYIFGVLFGLFFDIIRIN